MQKLTTRQMIILGIMAVAILYGIYSVFGNSRSKGTVTSAMDRAAELKTFVNTVALTVGKETPLAADAYVAARARSEWEKDVFLDYKSAADWLRAKEPAKAGTGKSVTFAYTGYIEGGPAKVAIINGIEYRAGDPLDVEGYTLRAILPSKVVIYSKFDKSQFEVPFQE